MSSASWRNPLDTVRRVIPILWESAPKWTVVATGLLILEVVFGLLSLYLVKGLVDEITKYLDAPGINADVSKILWSVAAFATASLVFLIVRGVASLAREAQGMSVADHVQQLIHDRAVRADLAFYESPLYFDTLQRARQAGSQRPAQVTSNLLLLGKNIVMLIAVVILLISINWLLLPILAFAIVPALVVRIYFTRELYEWRRKRTSMERRASYLDWLVTSEMHAKELRLNQLGELFRRQFRQLREQIRRESLGISKRRTQTELTVSTAAAMVFFCALAFLTWETALGNNSVGDLVLFLLVFQRAQSMGQEIVSQISKFYEDHLYIGLLFEFLDITPKVNSPNAPIEIPETITKGIELNDVSFQYPGCSELAIDSISMKLEPGKVIALVGANGSGKTSLIKLLTRLHDPVGGSISLDGIDIRNFRVEDYRNLFGVVFQDFTKYANTISENISFGDVRHFMDQESIERAAARAGATSFIESYPDGYQTLLGRLFEGGRDLSEGEWQKLALARGLMMRSRIIIMDEPTSAMDPDSEYRLFKNFRGRISGRTALVISHRLSTVRIADYIYVLQSGRVVEKGVHDELVAMGGIYKRSFERQAEGFF